MLRRSIRVMSLSTAAFQWSPTLFAPPKPTSSSNPSVQKEKDDTSGPRLPRQHASSSSSPPSHTFPPANPNTAALEKWMAKANNALFQKHHPGYALTMYDKAQEIADRIGSWRTLATLSMNRAYCLELCGDFEGAIQHYETATSMYVTQGFESHSLRLLLRLAHCHIIVGNHSVAQNVIARVDAVGNSGSGQQDDVGPEGTTVLWDPELVIVMGILAKPDQQHSISALTKVVEKLQRASSFTMFFANLHLARLQRNANRLKAASSSYAKCVFALSTKEDSDGPWPPTLHVEVLFEYANFLQYNRKDCVESLPLYKKALEACQLYPYWPAVAYYTTQIYFNLGAAHVSIDEREIAIPLLTKALKLFEEDGVVSSHSLYSLRLYILQCQSRDHKNPQELLKLYETLIEKIETYLTSLPPSGSKHTLENQMYLNTKQTTMHLQEVYLRAGFYLSKFPECAAAAGKYFKMGFKLLHGEDVNLEMTDALNTVDAFLYVTAMDAYSRLLRENGDELEANKYEDYLFDIDSTAKHMNHIPLGFWFRRVEQLELSGHYKTCQETLSFLVKKTVVSEPYPTIEQRKVMAANQLEVARRFAEFLTRRGCYSDASNFYSFYLEVDPNNAHVMVQHAWCMVRAASFPSEKYESAFLEAIRITEKQPEKWDACYVLGEYAVYLHEITRQLSDAAKMYGRALRAVGAETSQNYPQVLANFGTLLTSMGDICGGLKLLLKANELSPSNFGLWLMYLDAHLQIPGALEIAEKMMTMFPKEKSIILLRLAKIYEREDPVNVQKVLTTYITAMQTGGYQGGDGVGHGTEDIHQLMLKTNNVTAAAEYTSILTYRLRQYKEAAACYQILRERLPEDITIAVQYAKLLFEHNLDVPAALRLFDDIILVDPKNITAVECIAEWHTSQGNIDTAEDIYLQALRLYSEPTQDGSDITLNFVWLLYASWCVFCGSDMHKGGAILARLVQEHKGNDPTLHATYAAYLHRKQQCFGGGQQHLVSANDDSDVAEQMYKKALEQEPTNVSCLQNYAMFLATQKGDLEAAGKCFQQALELSPNDVDLQRLLATFLMYCGDTLKHTMYYEEAEKCFANIFRERPNDIPTLNVYALFMLNVKGDFVGAEKILKYVAELEAAEVPEGDNKT
eukprot:PhF_6_TR40525/c0_g1_i1/m.60698